MEKTKQGIQTKEDQIRELASELMQLARDTIVVNMRFLDMAVFALTPESREHLSGASTDGKKLY